jgi:hypothetical protein
VTEELTAPRAELPVLGSLSGLAHLESVDEEAIVYIRAANESAESHLTPSILAHSLGSVEAYIRQVHMRSAAHPVIRS